MNDLAERALRGLDNARRQLVGYPVTSLAIGGFLASALTVAGGGRVVLGRTTTPLSTWLGLQARHPLSRPWIAASASFAGICALVVLWLIALTVLKRRAAATPGGYPAASNDRTVWTLAGIWAIPFVLGPPLLTTDVYGYVARGLLQRNGLDPYVHAPLDLGNFPVVAAIEVTWRGTSSTAGPLATLLQHAVVTLAGGNALAAVLLYRAIAVASVIAIGMLVTKLAGARHGAALSLTILNPAVLLFVISAAHLEGLLAAVLLAAVVAATRDRWILGVVLVCLAAGFAPIMLLALPVLLLAHMAVNGSRTPWAKLGVELAAAALVLTGCALSVRNGMGWVHNLDEITREHTPFAPAAVLGDLINPIIGPASGDDLAAGARIAAGLAAGAIAVYLLVTTRRRPMARTIGCILLAVGLLAPVVYPWYLLPGLLVLAPDASGARRDWVIGLSAAVCVLVPVGFASDVAVNLTRVALAGIAIVLVVRLSSRRFGADAFIVRTR